MDLALFSQCFHSSFIMDEESPLGWDFEIGYMFLEGAVQTLEIAQEKVRALISKLEREASRTIWQELEGSV
jgi:hypothetical protein